MLLGSVYESDKKRGVGPLGVCKKLRVMRGDWNISATFVFS